MGGAKVRTGLDRVLAGEVASLRGARVGLIGHAASVDGELRHAVDLLAGRSDLTLAALFGPEHGIRGDAQDMIAVGEAADPRTGLPVHSLYGHDDASLAPRPGMLAGLDALLVDLQDVGARYYTFVWTCVLAMRAAAAAGVRVVVLDRPNPIGGRLVEGGAIAPGFHSFVGLLSVPNRHGCTVGELAAFANASERIGCALEVVTMTGWRRDLAFAETGLPWVLPSPNMPTCDTALVYPGLCLLEGTELSEGRGTTRPFEIVGAPYIDGDAWAASLAAERLPGVRFRPLVFRPTFQKFAGQACGGVQLHVTDADAFRPYLTGVALLATARRLWPHAFAWRRRAYEFVADVPAIDLLAGSDALRLGIDAGTPVADLAAAWRDDERALAEALRPHHLYE